METTADGVKLRDWDDMDAQREEIYDSTLKAVASKFPQVSGKTRLEIHDLEYVDPPHHPIHEQKKALMENRFLSRRLRGTWKLFDHGSGELLDERKATVMRVPVLTDRGTFIHGGSEYTTTNQARLVPGVYTRRKQNGEIESHFNTRRGTGQAFRVRLEPESGLFKMDIGQSSLRLYSLLKDLGVPDEQLEEKWGPELLAVNQKAYDSRVFDKAYAKLVRRPDPTHDRAQKTQAVRDALAFMRMDRSVVARTLPNRLQQKQASTPEFHREDYLLLANFLNQKFQAGIPLDKTEAELAEECRQELAELNVNINPQVLELALRDARKS